MTCDIGPVIHGLPQITVWVATLASASLERPWLVSIGRGTGPGLPAGGCVQGDGWAADVVVLGEAPSLGAVYVRTAHEMRGRVVSAGWCY